MKRKKLTAILLVMAMTSRTSDRERNVGDPWY